MTFPFVVLLTGKNLHILSRSSFWYPITPASRHITSRWTIVVVNATAMDFADYFRHMALMDQQPSIGQMVQMMGANNLEQKVRQRKATLREAKNAPGRAALLARL